MSYFACEPMGFSPMQIERMRQVKPSKLPIQISNYRYEGIQCYIYLQQNTNTVLLFRFYNPGSAVHFYTTNRAEGDNAVQNLGYQEEAAPGFVFEQAYVCQPSKQTVLPLHRYYNSGNDDHFYTTNFEELLGGI